MGVVYEAEQHARATSSSASPSRSFARVREPEKFIENFIGEAKLVADLIHTNIVQTYQSARPARFITSR